MKKLSILLIGLLLVTGFAFAQDVTFSGDATLTIGYDIDEAQFGFKNAASSALAVKWTFEDAKGGGTGAFIELTKMSFEAKDDAVNIDDPTVKAGLIFAPITVTIYSAPSMKFDNAAGFKFTPDKPKNARNDIKPELAENNVATAAATTAYGSTGELVVVDDATGTDPTDAGAYEVSDQAGYDLWFVPDAAAAAVGATWQGVTVTAALAPITLDVWLATDGTWVENTDNAVAFGAVATVAVDPLTLKAGVIYGPTDAAALGATVDVSGTFGPATVDVGFDLFESDFDASAKIALDLGVASITSLTYLTSIASTLEMYEEVVIDASAAVEALTLKNTTQLETILLTDGLEWYNATDVAYDLGGIKPFAKVELYDVGADLQVDAEAGVELTGMIELTTFKLLWSADDVTATDPDLGALTFETKIKY